MEVKKLQSKDRMLVSPAFELMVDSHLVPFRIMVQAKRKSHKKGGDSFGKARGVGSIHLKCEALVEEIFRQATFELMISVGGTLWRGPVRHNFARDSVAGLPPCQQNWNLRSAVVAASQTVAVYVEVKCVELKDPA